MKIGSLLAGCLPALLLVACGGDSKPNATDTASTATPKAASKPAPKAADTAQDPKPKRRRQRRPRVNTQLVKTLFGNDPAWPKAPVASTPELVALGNALYHSEHL